MNCFRSSIMRIYKSFKKCVFSQLNIKHYSISTPDSTTEYCLDLVRHHDYENFLCTLLLPNNLRTSAFAIRAFNTEVAKVQDQVSDPRLGQMRMKFWEEVVERIYSDNAPSHPVALELHRATQQHKLSKRYLKRLVVARADHLTSATFSDLEAVESYAEQSVSPIYYLLLEAAGVQNIHADHAASHLGKAHGIANLIRSIPYNAQKRLVALPQDVLLRHSVSHEEILRFVTSQHFKDAVFDIAGRAKQHLDKARSLKNTVPKSAYTVFLPAVTVDLYLEKLRVRDFDVFSPSLQQRNNSVPLVLFWNKLRSSY